MSNTLESALSTLTLYFLFSSSLILWKSALVSERVALASLRKNFLTEGKGLTSISFPQICNFCSSVMDEGGTYTCVSSLMVVQQASL